MSIQIIKKENQAYGAFNGGEIVENKPIGFPREGGPIKPYSSLFYWANATAKVDSTIGLHPHQGFEIMSFVLEGSIRHYDTQLKDWKELHKGDAQIIRAGSGISHAEHMNQGSRMFQIWVDPNINKTMQQTASYDDYKSSDIPVSKEDESITLHYVGEKGIMKLDTSSIEIEKWAINGEKKLAKLDVIYSIYVLSGEVDIDGHHAVKDDFIIVDGKQATLKGESELFVIASAKELDYETYGELMQKRI